MKNIFEQHLLNSENLKVAITQLRNELWVCNFTIL